MHLPVNAHDLLHEIRIVLLCLVVHEGSDVSTAGKVHADDVSLCGLDRFQDLRQRHAEVKLLLDVVADWCW